MHSLTLEMMGIATGWILQAVLAVVLMRKGLARAYAIFLLYLLFNLIEDPLSSFFHSNAFAYRRFYFGASILDYLFQLLILFEIGLNVLRPSKRSIPFPVLPVFTVILLVCAILAASFSPKIQLSGLQHASELFVRVSLSLAVLKLLLFAGLAGFAQFLGINWKNLVFQFASGFALFGAVSLLIQLSIQHTSTANHAAYIAHFVTLSHIQAIAYLLILIFWIWAFSRNESPRKDFTPQMQQVLVTIAGTAKRTRLAVTRGSDHR